MIHRPLSLSPEAGARGQDVSSAGYSLIETVVAMGLILMLMTVSGALFTALIRSERNAQRAAVAQQTLSRLEALFRGDVHRANSAVIAANDLPPTLTLSLPGGGTVRYIAQNAKLERIAEAGGGAHRDDFRLPDAKWSFQIAGDANRRVELRLERPADTVTQQQPAALPKRETRLMAILALTPATPPKTGAAP